MDALFQRGGAGDIGRHFPDTDPAYKGADSGKLLDHVVALLEEKGYAVGNADVTIICQRPKLKDYIEQMRENVARHLKVDIDCVNIKATTTEKLGFEGEGLGISSHAVACIEKSITHMAKKSRNQNERNIKAKPRRGAARRPATLLDRVLEGFAAAVVAVLRRIQLADGGSCCAGCSGWSSACFAARAWPLGRLWRLMTGRRNRAQRCLQLTGFEFEEYMAQVLGTTAFGTSGDGGVRRSGRGHPRRRARAAKPTPSVQELCGAVGNAAVQEAYAGAEYYGCDIPVVVCPTEFTASARELAESTGVELWDGERLSHMMRVSGRRPHHDQAGRRAIIRLDKSRFLVS